MRREDHYYVYQFKSDDPQSRGIPTYERTCGTRRGAEERVAELIRRGYDLSFFTVNMTVRKSWY